MTGRHLPRMTPGLYLVTGEERAVAARQLRSPYTDERTCLRIRRRHGLPIYMLHCAPPGARKAYPSGLPEHLCALCAPSLAMLDETPVVIGSVTG